MPNAMNSESKTDTEKRVFEWFANAAGLRVVGQIQQPDPPDIVAEIDGHGRVAFELVCVDAQEEFYKHEKFRKTDAAMERELASLPEARRVALVQKFSDAEINVQLPEDVPWKAVSFEPIWDILEKLPPAFEEEVRCPAHVAEFLWIYRNAGHKGPTFSTISGGMVLNINLDPIANKLAKRYDSEPLELLAYTNLQDIAHRSDSATVEALVCSKLRGSSFRKVWLFDAMLKRLELSVALTDVGAGGGFQIFRARP